MSDMLNAALAWHDAGFCVVPVYGLTKPNNPKAVALHEWTTYKETRRSTEAEIREWFRQDDGRGIGIVTGVMSGNLEMLEFEGRAMSLMPAFVAQLGELAPKVLSYVEQSASGGWHFFYRVPAELGAKTIKLAQRPNPEFDIDNPTKASKSLTLIETRGQGGQVVVAPSHFPVPLRENEYSLKEKYWTVVQGDYLNIATITEEERNFLYGLARVFDECPQSIDDFTVAQHSDESKEGTPGSDFNKNGHWEEVLEPAGYIKWRMQNNGGQQWTRPGKSEGPSLVTGGGEEGADYLWAYSTSCYPLESEKPYSKWRAYAILHCGSDWSKAAGELRNKGYGAPREHVIHNIITLGGGVPVQVDEKAIANVSLDTEHGMAQLLIDKFGPIIRYVPEHGRWHVWNEKQWKPSEDSNGGLVREMVKIISCTLPDADKTEHKWKTHCLSANGTSHIVTQARTDTRVVLSTKDIDSNPFELNTPGGIIDLRTRNMRAHDPAAMHSRLTLVEPDFSADLRPWTEFLNETFKGNEDVISYVHKLVGYSATGLVREHLLPFAYGSGGNGKGVFLETIQKLLGDYGTTSPNGFLMATQFQSHETEVARLTGARMVLCSEVNKNDRFDEAKVKQLTGGDSLTARFMRQDHFTFQPTHKLWLMGNDYPAVESGGRSFWRRVKLLPFLNEVEESKVDVTLGERLISDHGPAIMAWIVYGAVLYFQSGLKPEPSVVVAATNEYAHEQDVFGSWFENACYFTGSKELKIRTSIVRASYENWCRGEGAKPISPNEFGRRMKRCGIEKTRSDGKGFYLGLMLGDEKGAEENTDNEPRQQGMNYYND